MKKEGTLTRAQQIRNEILEKKIMQENISMAKNHAIQHHKQPRQWGLYSKQRKIEIKTQIITKPDAPQNETKIGKQKKNWQYGINKNKFVAKILPSNVYYPPSCSGYDIAYSRTQEAIYVYGGISCASDLSDGIKQHFYKYSQGKWAQVKPQSLYNPTPRYGHTLTAYQKDLILFGGVSEYKQKLKDRCFYTDCSAYSTVKNNWRVLQSTGQLVKTRKNHSACIYMKYYIVYGGLDQSEEVVNQISWINLDCKKPRWKNSPLEGRFNQKMQTVQTQAGKDFLCIFGGRNSQSKINNTFFVLPLSITDGQLSIKQFTIVNHQISAREMPIMTDFLQGFIILGGVDENSSIVEDCWYYNAEKQMLEQINLNIDFNDLRGAKGCSIRNQRIYVLAGNSLSYKALSLEFDK